MKPNKYLEKHETLSPFQKAIYKERAMAHKNVILDQLALQRKHIIRELSGLSVAFVVLVVAIIMDRLSESPNNLYLMALAGGLVLCAITLLNALNDWRALTKGMKGSDHVG